MYSFAVPCSSNLQRYLDFHSASPNLYLLQAAALPPLAGMRCEAACHTHHPSGTGGGSLSIGQLAKLYLTEMKSDMATLLTLPLSPSYTYMILLDRVSLYHSAILSVLYFYTVLPHCIVLHYTELLLSAFFFYVVHRMLSLIFSLCWCFLECSLDTFTPDFQANTLDPGKCVCLCVWFKVTFTLYNKLPEIQESAFSI